ncbi:MULTISPECIES: hypothetical protein [Bacillus amyloliquefaciens group]|uniref:hypothetical protein n=1 Tax=Bacillus amyloliquefaciens group TaxID=1938374 RepID=UPI001C640A96|nr:MULTISPECIES: hypothetical protein [Bacillus amyloliquefaciens group]MDV5127001.1 hypothetical protein [Bacillus velezensis]QYJ63491.1 hypothetical protein J8615_10590 [Bacillus velezensis]
MKEINMIERSYCGSGGCMSCPFSHSDEAEMVQNYGCLPTPQQIVEMKEKSGHNWACHSDETVLCGGFAKYIKRNRPDLNINEGQLISYETWGHEGEAKAIQEANTKELRQAQEKISRLRAENNRFKEALQVYADENKYRRTLRMSQWATVENEKRFGDFNPSFMEVDRGQIAREALEGAE